MGDKLKFKLNIGSGLRFGFGVNKGREYTPSDNSFALGAVETEWNAVFGEVGIAQMTDSDNSESGE